MLVICALGLSFVHTMACADSILVIAHQDAPVDSMSQSEAANLFLGIGHHELTPFDQEDRQLRNDFYKKVANLSLASVRAHWAKLVFTGRGHPPEIIDRNNLEQFIKNHPDAVTYIPAVNPPPGCKILLSLDTGE